MESLWLSSKIRLLSLLPIFESHFRRVVVPKVLCRCEKERTWIHDWWFGLPEGVTLKKGKYIWKKGKCIPHYTSIYKILRCICNVAYKLDLSVDLASILLGFYVSLFKKCISDQGSLRNQLFDWDTREVEADMIIKYLYLFNSNSIPTWGYCSSLVLFSDSYYLVFGRS